MNDCFYINTHSSLDFLSFYTKITVVWTFLQSNQNTTVGEDWGCLLLHSCLSDVYSAKNTTKVADLLNLCQELKKLNNTLHFRVLQFKDKNEQSEERGKFEGSSLRILNWMENSLRCCFFSWTTFHDPQSKSLTSIIDFFPVWIATVKFINFLNLSVTSGYLLIKFSYSHIRWLLLTSCEAKEQSLLTATVIELQLLELLKCSAASSQRVAIIR